MKLILLFIPALLAAFQWNLDISTVYTNTLKSPTEDSYHSREAALDTYAAFRGSHIVDNLKMSFNITTQYEDSYLEELNLAYFGRYNNLIYTTTVGVLPTFQGVFSTGGSFKEQLPFIHKNSGVYTDEFLGGWLNNVIGVEQEIGYLLNYRYLISLKGIVAKARNLDAGKAEQAVWGYESDYAEVTHNDYTKDLSLTLSYRDSLSLFYESTWFSIDIEPTHSMTLPEQYSEYLRVGDPSVFEVTSPTDVEVQRIGLLYTNAYLFYGFEHLTMHMSNSQLGVDMDVTGKFHYIGGYLCDYFTLYGSFGSSINGSGREYKESIVGGRWFYTKDFAIIGEVLRTNWIQHNTFEQHKAFLASGESEIDMISVQVMYSF